MLRKLFGLSCMLSLCAIIGCNDSESDSCVKSEFVDHCDGNTYVECVTFSNDDNGTIFRDECGNGYCMSIDNKVGCYSDDCDKVGEQMGKQECRIEDLNKPSMYDYVCVQEGNIKHWHFEKVSDCDGACIEGNKECYKLNDECDLSKMGDIGCNGRDLYYCDGNLDYSKTVKSRHCKDNQICVQDDIAVYCADTCTEEGKDTFLCSNNNRALNNRLCSSTKYGLYYTMHPTSIVHIEPDHGKICKETEFVPFEEFVECNPATDKSYCDHNTAVRCYELGDGEYKWIITHCGTSDSYYRQYGLCQVVDDKALCLATCQEKGAAIKTCGANYEFEGLGTNLLLAMTYECREIDGNLFAYPVSSKECKSCNDEYTDCAE